MTRGLEPGRGRERERSYVVILQLINDFYVYRILTIKRILR